MEFKRELKQANKIIKQYNQGFDYPVWELNFAKALIHKEAENIKLREDAPRIAAKELVKVARYMQEAETRYPDATEIDGFEIVIKQAMEQALATQGDK